MPTLDSYSRKKRKRGENASITIMRSGQFGNYMCQKIDSTLRNLGRRSRRKKEEDKTESTSTIIPLEDYSAQ
jgi:hypothetical protein